MASFILDKTHEAIRSTVREGDTVVDATVGNGWDTVFLARLVGPSGHVVGFDVQAVAIDGARSMLALEGLLERCTLIKQSHDTPAGALRTAGADQPKAVMFNLGYLPGGDRSVTTTPMTTVAALNEMFRLLAPGGMITVVAYQGHPGAKDELYAVEDWLDQQLEQDLSYERISDPLGPTHAPVLFVVTKR